MYMFKFCSVEDLYSWTLFSDVSVFKPIYSLHLPGNLLVIVVSTPKRPVCDLNWSLQIPEMPKSNKTSCHKMENNPSQIKQAPMMNQALIKMKIKKLFWINLIFNKLFQACLCLILRVPRWTGLSMMVLIIFFKNGDGNVKTYCSVSLQCLQREENARKWLPGVVILGFTSMCIGILPMKYLP